MLLVPLAATWFAFTDACGKKEQEERTGMSCSAKTLAALCTQQSVSALIRSRMNMKQQHAEERAAQRTRTLTAELAPLALPWFPLLLPPLLLPNFAAALSPALPLPGRVFTFDAAAENARVSFSS
jgi:hypothetical protein